MGRDPDEDHHSGSRDAGKSSQSTDSPQVQLMGDAIDFVRKRHTRLLTSEFGAGDLIVFSMTDDFSCNTVGLTGVEPAHAIKGILS